MSAVQLERLTRIKGAGGFPSLCIDEVLDISGASRRDVDVITLTRNSYPRRFLSKQFFLRKIVSEIMAGTPRERMFDVCAAMKKNPSATEIDLFDCGSFCRAYGFRSDVTIHFENHHKCHALPSLFFTDWEDALLYTADGSGDNVCYSARTFIDGTLTTLFGDDRWLYQPQKIDSLGLAYGYITEALGWKMLRHEGKLTGLAAFGQPTLFDEIAQHFHVQSDGVIDSDFNSFSDMRHILSLLARNESRENAAASIQLILEEMIVKAIRILLEQTKVRHLGLSGGVFANVRLNRRLAEELPVEEVFIVPPMGDEGLVVGAGLSFLLKRDGLSHWLKQRHRLTSVCLGRDYNTNIETAVSCSPRIRREIGNPIELTVDRLIAGKVGAIYNGRTEFGPRALGARTILGHPGRAEINDILNKRLNRTEFMPFAPVVAADRAAAVFDVGPLNRYAARFMTITCGVRPEWHKLIPAVVHVDGSARPQIIERDENPLYYDILKHFEKKTGLPVLINTSFNAHEEPIINNPEECARALLDNRVDFVVTTSGVWECNKVDCP